MEKSLPRGKGGWTLIMSEFGPRPFRRGWREPRQGGIQAERAGREEEKTRFDCLERKLFASLRYGRRARAVPALNFVK